METVKVSKGRHFLKKGVMLIWTQQIWIIVLQNNAAGKNF